MTRSLPRLHVTQGLASGIVFSIEGNPAHYLQHVMRLKVGHKIRVFNGQDGEWQAEISGSKRDTVTLNISHQTRAQFTSLPIVLAFAPLKKTSMDFLIIKATELGVSVLQPIITERSENKRINLIRLQAQIREASEQCERLDLPILNKAINFCSFLDNWPKSSPLWCCNKTSRGPSLPEALLPLNKKIAAHSHGFLIGPEGGFSPNELASLGGFDFVNIVSLGPRILRAETAAIAALTCWQSLLGDWCR